MPQGYGSGGSGVPGHRSVWTSADVHIFYVTATALYYAIDWGRRVQVSSNADPATVINAAITYVNGTLGGGQIRILEGTYSIVDSLAMADNVLISGEGYGTFLDGDGLANNEHLFILSGDTDCGIRDMRMQTADGGGNTIHCIFIEDGSNNFRIDNVTIVDSDSDGIHVEGTNILGGWITNCGILDTDDVGISISMDAANYADYLHINNNVVTSAGLEGLSLTDVRYSEISGNDIDQCTQDGIELNLTTDCLVVDNFVYLNVQHGISLVDADRNIIEDNICHTNDSGDAATYDGINVDGDSTENLIEGNYCYLNKRYGIMTSGLRTSILGNYVWGNDRHGIYEDVTDCLINDNFCYDNGQDAAGTYHGIYVGGARTEVIGNFCTDPGDSTEDGIFLASGADQCNITGNFCYNLMGDGIELNANVEYSIIASNICSSNDDHGIVLSANDCEYNLISGNYCLSNGLDGIDVAGEECIINNNICYGNSQTVAGASHGIILQAGADRCLVDGNHCNSRGADQEDGVHLADGATDNIISNNYCYNGMGDGIQLIANNDNCVIDGNVCLTNDDHGIVTSADTCERALISNNICADNGLDGIDVAGEESGVEGNICYDNSQTQAGSSHGIILQAGADRCIVDGNLCDSPGDSQENGVFLADGAAECVISNNYFYNGMGDGIELYDNNSYCLIEGNHCHSNDDYGIILRTEDIMYCTIQNNFLCFNGLEGIEVNGSDNSINDNFIYNNGQLAAGTYNGIYLGNAACDRCQINDNWIGDDGTNQEIGIELVNGASDCLISGNFIYNHMGQGIYLGQNNVDCSILNNFITTNDDQGIYVGASSDRTAINNNHLILNGQHGIQIEAPQCQINANYIYMNGQTAAATYHGIVLNAGDADNCQINDNYIADDGANVEDGIHLVDGVSNCLIDGNYIRNHMGDGIDLVANNDDNQIKNNYINFNDDYGVRIRAATCNNNVVQNNKFVGNITGAISDGGTDTALGEHFLEVNDPDYTLGPHPVIRLPDSVNTNLRIQWLAPKEFQELVRVRGVYVCDASGNMDYWDYGQFGKKCLEPWNMHYASTAEAVHAFSYAGSFECISHAGSLTGIAAGDLAGIRIGRGGANAADTINDDCYFLGLEVEYV